MTDTVKIKFNDNIEHVYPKGTSYYEISKNSDVKRIVGFKIGNEVFGLDKKAYEDAKVKFINTDDIIGNRMYKSGLKFLFQVALKEAYPDLDVVYEHSVPNGMIAVIEGDKILTADEVRKIKDKMNEIILSDEVIEKINIVPKEAIKFYRSNKELEKAANIQNISDKVVTLYKLRGELNYFYSLMPYSTKVLDKYNIVYLGNNKLVLLFPSVRSNGEVPEYTHYSNIIDSFYEGKSWLDCLHMPYITDLNKLVSNGDIKKFMESCELKFTMDISTVVKDIKEKKDVKFILIAGPSSSGKTTTMKRIASHFDAQGYNTIKIGLDDYFVNREDTPVDENGNYNFECLEAIDVKLFNEDLNKLLAGEEVTLPHYNFITGKREVSEEKIKIKDNTIFLIEGLHALNGELTKAVDDKFKYKIYLSPFIPLSIDKHNYISTLDLRLLRRIVRDNRTRGYNVVDTIDHWQNVRDGEEKYIFPYVHQVDVIINTALAYEIGVLKVFVEPLLLSVSVDSVYYEEARRLVDFLKQFFAIPGEYVKDESILREFIGGKNYD